MNESGSKPGTKANPNLQENPMAERRLTIPNVICFVRLFGSIGLIPVAILGERQTFLWVFLFLAMTDWIDGKLAILLDQRTLFGARLDSWADTALYAALLAGLLIMKGSTIQAESLWFGAAIMSYAVSGVSGYLKFGRWPSYHTRAAKTAWFFILVATTSLLLDWEIWPVRVALSWVVLTNVEAVLITLVLPSWQANVTSIYHAWRNQVGDRNRDESGR